MLKTFTDKYGKLVEPAPYEWDGSGGHHVDIPSGIYFAGEGVSADGKLLKRCISKFDFANHPNDECGLMARVSVSFSDGVAKSARVTIADFRLKRALEARVSALKSQATSAQQSEALNSAEIVNAF